MIPKPLHLEVGACTETGYVRNENQDRMSWATVPLGQLYLIADGMGGHAGGAQAAELTIQGLERHLSEASDAAAVNTVIRNAFDQTNHEIYDKAHAGNPMTEGMGSTAVMLLIFGRFAKIAHVGDSRAYLYRNGKLRRLTKDHSQVQRMVDEGLLTPEQARIHPYSSVLDRAIGNAPTVTTDISANLILKNGDGILLCSDGLSGYADDREIEAVLDNSLTPQENVDRLIDLALQKGGEDNITIQLVRLNIGSPVRWRRDQFKSESILISILMLGLALAAGYFIYRTIVKFGEVPIYDPQKQFPGQTP